MVDPLKPWDFPELVFGIAGPIGVDVDAITDSLSSALRVVRYQSEVIKLTTEMKVFATDVSDPKERDFHSEVMHKIKYANALCERYQDASTLARIAIRAIASRRREITGQPNKIPEKVAYIVRQLKRPDEVALLRRVYGRQFVLVSAYGSAEQRKKLIEAKLKRSLSTLTSEPNISFLADELIDKDASEQGEKYGQQLRETFHLADVFIDGISKQEMDEKLERFIQAFFGRTDIAPSKNEYGMYAAKSASLRSSDLSRQVGAAIFSKDGELITQGCNEVPKAFGGTYWDLEQPDFRDVRLGHDPNEILKKELLRDLFERLSKAELLSEKAINLGGPADMVDALSRKADKGEDADGPLVGAIAMDLTEYGRVVHAEMCAICDAARIGRSVKGATLYCTTFPCHNCTKHILAAGIERVVYMEPYPKSKAKDLHENEIEIENESATRVSFVPFLGISPFRYRDIFQKGKRKNPDGTAKRWLGGDEKPMLEIVTGSYMDVELVALGPLVGQVTPKEPIAVPTGKASSKKRAVVKKASQGDWKNTRLR
ncbi:cytidine deaminase [Microvirga lupini]|uniref:Cytidine deaminase n=1 Tax=Microvirga lupini TaxID=420324 RepID=A0A7W4YWE4_9HYPH|nr:anti-phage dCTP deaminase [Microvirga lupini]MBB3017903.1 cytidine deaminase [Microvirga lupini]